MYEEIRKDLENRMRDLPKTKVARWDEAIKSLLAAASDADTPLPVAWLSDRSGLSKSYLLNVMSGKIKDPPSEKLIRIADSFNISFPEFASRALSERVGAFYKTGFNERALIDYSQHGFTMASLSPPGVGSRDFFMGLMTIKPLKELKRWQFKDNSMIGLFVESGTLEVAYGGRKYKLHSNESAYFDASVPHKIKNIDTFEARVFLVTRPPLH